MRATTLWVVFTLFIVIYQATALPLAPHKEAEEKEKTPEVQKQEVKEDKEKDEKVQDDDKDSEDDGSADDEDEQENEGVDNNDEDGSASADKQDDDDDSKERNQRSAEESGEAPTKAVATKKKSAAGKPVKSLRHHRTRPGFRRCAGCGGGGGDAPPAPCCACGCCGRGCSWGVCDLCRCPQCDGWCGAGCQCANCCGGFGCPITNNGCNSGCCPSVTFPCSFGACVNNPCCECCREPAPKGKCKWPCLWPCCCECTPPKFKFKPLKPKPICHCPNHCCGHKRSVSKKCPKIFPLPASPYVQQGFLAAANPLMASPQAAFLGGAQPVFAAPQPLLANPFYAAPQPYVQMATPQLMPFVASPCGVVSQLGACRC